MCLYLYLLLVLIFRSGSYFFWPSGFTVISTCHHCCCFQVFLCIVFGCEYCVYLASGPMHYTRTCESNLNIGMPIAMVCMKESRPGNGKLCFCHRQHCNVAQPAVTPLPTMLLLPILVLIHYLGLIDYTVDWLWDRPNTADKQHTCHPPRWELGFCHTRTNSSVKQTAAAGLSKHLHLPIAGASDIKDLSSG